MFRRASKIFAPSTTPHGKLKQKILNIATAMLLASSLLVDAINARTGSHQNALTVLIENIGFMIPWGLTYLIAFRHRSLLKTFTPLYICSILLAATGSLTFHSFTQTRHLEDKFHQEMTAIIQDHANFLRNMESAPQTPRAI